MIVLVCGGRDYPSEFHVHFTLSEFHKDTAIDLLIEGGCPTGADRFASAWASCKGIHSACVDALWNKFGPSAGPLRNQAMLLLKPDVVIAFEGGKGTADMVRRALDAGVKVIQK